MSLQNVVWGQSVVRREKWDEDGVREYNVSQISDTNARMDTTETRQGLQGQELTLFDFDEINAYGRHLGDHRLSKCIGNARVGVCKDKIAIVIIQFKDLQPQRYELYRPRAITHSGTVFDTHGCALAGEKRKTENTPQHEVCARIASWWNAGLRVGSPSGPETHLSFCPCARVEEGSTLIERVRGTFLTNKVKKRQARGIYVRSPKPGVMAMMMRE